MRLPMRLGRAFAGAVGTLSLVGAIVLGACAEPKGALMLAISTDMKAPKDVNAVSVTISNNGAIKHSFIGRVTPQGDVLLPATLAIVEPDDTGGSIRIRVMAFQDRRPRVLRDIRTTIPTGGRTALLRIPLNFVNDGSTKSAPLPPGVVPDPVPGTGGTSTGGGSSGGPATPAGEFDFFGSFQPECPDIENQTFIDGVCQDNFVDANALPDFDSALIGDSLDKGQCFDVARCFSAAVTIGEAGSGVIGADSGSSTADGSTSADASTPPRDGGAGFKDLRISAITLDRTSCSLALNGSNPQRLNLAVVTPDTGECVRPGECYIPIDRGGAGWVEQNGRVQLPLFVCRLLGGKNLRLATSSETCAAKEESNPICAEKPVAVEPATGGCAGFAAAYCEKITSCGFNKSFALGDVTSCKTYIADYCTETHKAPGTKPVTAECAAGFRATTCEQLDAFDAAFGLRCYFDGTLPNASPCQFDEQCVAGNCVGESESRQVCGVCMARVPLGADCGSQGSAPGPRCELGLQCDGVKCVAPVIRRAGEECASPGSRCVKSNCFQGRCVADLPEGAACASSSGASCDYASGLACIPVGSPDARCQKLTTVTQVGAPCGGRDLGPCALDLTCAGSGAETRGTCQPSPAAGQPCADGAGSECRGTADCVNGICTAVDPLRCNR